MSIPTAGTEPGLIVRRADPLNCETSIPRLLSGMLTPSALFYVRNHFPVPALDPASWRLRLGGLVRRPLTLGLADLLNLPAQTLQVTLECAGNGRSLLSPAVAGEQWGLGAVSTARWTGVRLADVLDRAGLESGAREVVFTGADGPPGTYSTAGRFRRSLTTHDAQDPHVLLAYAMNDEPLPPEHGFPLRLIVPGWYGVSAVKWLTDIEVIDHAFRGHFQTEKYLYESERDGRLVREPVRQQRVRALTIQPSPCEVVDVGGVAVGGVAWSGVAPVDLVEVSVNGGPWQPARMLGLRTRYTWRRWELIVRVHQRGRTTIRARATDRAGRRQPEQAPWNRQGYGNNAIQQVALWAR